MSRPLHSAQIRRPLTPSFHAATSDNAPERGPGSLASLRTKELVPALPRVALLEHAPTFATPHQELSFLPLPISSQRWV